MQQEMPQTLKPRQAVRLLLTNSRPQGKVKPSKPQR
jgi:hypothetical protein